MNRKQVVVLLWAAVMSTSALAVGFMGPPTAELNEGQWNIGYNYTYSDMDLEKTRVKGFFVFEGPLDEPFEVRDFKTQRHYFTVGYGITDAWEVYGQLGASDVKFEGTLENGWEGLNFDNDFAWGWGTRLTLSEQDNVKWGLSAQMNWLDTSWDDNFVEDTGEGTVTGRNIGDLETYDLLVAFGPTVDMGGWKLYGGPFYYMLNGDLDFTTKADGFGTVGTANADLEEDSNFGGFAGAVLNLAENMDMTIEFAATGDGWAVGTGIGWKF